MFLAYIRLKMPLDVPGTSNGILRILYTNNIAVVISTKEPLKMRLIQGVHKRMVRFQK
jgi:hypothetical protein